MRRQALIVTSALVALVFSNPAAAVRGTDANPPSARIKVTTAALRAGLAAWPEATDIPPDGSQRHDGSKGGGHAMKHACIASTESTLAPIGRRHFEEWEDVITDDGKGGTIVTQRNVRTWLEVSVPCGAGNYTALRCVYGDCPQVDPTVDIPPPGIDVARLAAQYAPYEIPVPILSPSLTQPGASIIVGLPFFWAIDPGQWRDIHATGRGCNGIACTEATITGRPTELYFTPGDSVGDIRTCHRPGTVVRSADVADAQGDDCTYIFQNRGRFTGAVGIHYEVSFTASDGTGGAIGGQDIEVDVELPVTEVQAVITG